MACPPVTIHKRQPVTKTVLLSWALRFMHCAICGDRLVNGFEDDHIIPIANGGDNSPLNRQPLCKPCHKRKTKSDTAKAAKAKRQAGETGQRARRARKGGSMMQSQGFYRPKGYNAQWAKRSFNQPYTPNVKEYD